MDFFSVIFVILIVILCYIWVYALKINKHWERHGIPSPKPVPFFGNLLPLVLGRQHLSQILKNIYDDFPNEPVVGFYFFTQPRLLIRDCNYIERFFFRDFQYFSARMGTSDIRHDPLNSSLFVLHGKVWKVIRGKFAPMFTSGKLRSMFPHIHSIGDTFVDHIGKTTEPIEVMEKMSTYTVNVLASAAYGVETGFMDEDHEFTKKSRKIFPSNVTTFLRSMIIFTMPMFARMVKLTFIPRNLQRYFFDIVKEALRFRRTSGVIRNDFVQLMNTLQEKGVVEVESLDKEDEYLRLNEDTEIKIQLDDDFMAGQSLGFLLAGIDTTSLMLTYMVYDLAVNSKAQETARTEIEKITASFKGQFTYDSLKEMVYLESCIKESLRIHSVFSMVMRICTKKYEIPEISYIMHPGENIVASPEAIHLNPEYYTEPTKFCPNRWMTDPKPPGISYFPWGLGPRTCIGKRFAEIEIKIVLAKMLLNYEFSLHSGEIPISLKPLSFFNTPAKKIMVKFKKINRNSCI